MDIQLSMFNLLLQFRDEKEFRISESDISDSDHFWTVWRMVCSSGHCHGAGYERGNLRGTKEGTGGPTGIRDDVDHADIQ
jgi:hypothetical protein